MIGDSDFPSFLRMFILHVTASLPMELPTVILYCLNNISDFSYHVLYILKFPMRSNRVRSFFPSGLPVGLTDVWIISFSLPNTIFSKKV